MIADGISRAGGEGVKVQSPVSVFPSLGRFMGDPVEITMKGKKG